MYTIRNQEFEICFNKDTGTVIGIYHVEDDKHMNWVEGEMEWGVPALFPFSELLTQKEKIKQCLFEAQSISFEDDVLKILYVKSNIEIMVVRQLDEKGYYSESYTIRNTGSTELFLEKGTLGIFTTFNDNYQEADTCLAYKCHTHLWCMGNTSYINAVKMSALPPHLGLALTKGALDGYSILRDTQTGRSNDRGDFVLNPATSVLGPNESFCIEWKLFFYEKDFFANYRKIPGMLYAQADTYTLFIGEEGHITAHYTGIIESAFVEMEDTEIPYVVEGSIIKLTISPTTSGEKVIKVTVNDKTALLRINVVQAFETILKNRVYFIASKQQYHKAGSPLDGAYLIYDKETNSVYYDSTKSDHNCGRERVVMGVIMACYLQKNKDEFIEHSLLQYITFIRRELFDSDTGIVYNNAQRDNSWHRNYNYPWIATLWIEMFHLTKEIKYLKDMYRCLMAYYSNNGKNFYAIGIPMIEAIDLLSKNQLKKEVHDLLQHFISHGEVILKNGMHYPAHEVKYEQSIVAPAVSYLCQLYILTKDKRYLDEAKNQIPILDAFGFKQPDYHLNEIAIRHWDGYYFGKRRLFGDTFPHYWSVLSGEVFARYTQITGNQVFAKKAQQIFRNNLCLFEADGFGSCAYLYPNYVNGQKAAFYDPWANDQDWALYYANKLGILTPTFSLIYNSYF